MSTTTNHLETAGGRELQETIDRLLSGKRDPEAQRLALDRMNRMREEMRLRTGDVDVVLPLLRELRDE